MVARSNDKCSHCGKAHPSEKCWKKFAHLRPQNKGSSKSEKKMVCWKCGGDHTKKECPKYKGKKDNSESTNGVFFGSVHFETLEKSGTTYSDKVKHQEGKEFDCGSNVIRKSRIERATQELKQLLLGQSEVNKTSNSCG